MPTMKHGLLMIAALAAFLSTRPALSEEVPDQLHGAKLVIRATLLGTTEWAYEWGHSQDRADGARNKFSRCRAWFAEKDGQLIGNIDGGLKCNSEVSLREDGFYMATCFGNDKRFVRSGDEFNAPFGSYIHIIRPAP